MLLGRVTKAESVDDYTLRLHYMDGNTIDIEASDDGCGTPILTVGDA